MKLNTHVIDLKKPMVQIWRPGDNFCAFETLSKMVDLKVFFALMQKRQSFLLPYYTSKATTFTAATSLDNVFCWALSF
jgi:hypothetical protein